MVIGPCGIGWRLRGVYRWVGSDWSCDTDSGEFLIWFKSNLICDFLSGRNLIQAERSLYIDMFNKWSVM